MDRKKLGKIKKIAKELGEEALGVYLYGSYAGGQEHARSDIDICVVAGEKVKELYSKTNIIMAKHPGLDIKLLEELPLHIKKRVIEKGILLHSRDEPALAEYLRFYRKLEQPSSCEARIREGTGIGAQNITSTPFQS